ncbi:MAG: LamG-like jellyroll fold domain-containing protein [Phocaeicola sp.]|uniref:LamG-like jellyroll fold domain-containing protein n=1 Tax=Phocaeicola TaxID=909656 RepID=UPI00234E9E00|nr:LamG-like jellyroll fold domain-containing protein [Phocaeicola oris]MCE2617447.1 hypothetical protein [Phocaeicola oris]
MKNILTYIGIASLILLTGCANHEVTEQDLSGKTSERTLTLTASMPTESNTRVTMTENDEGNLSLAWKAGDKISLCFVKGTTVKTLADVPVTNIGEGGKMADFKFMIPDGITEPFNLYGIYGAELEKDLTTVTFPKMPSGSALTDTESINVMRFDAENVTMESPLSVAFSYLGSLLGVWLTNSSDADYMLTGLSLQSGDDYHWLYNASGQATYDIATGTYINKEAGSQLDFPLPEGGLPVASGETSKVYAWIVPTAESDVTQSITATMNETAMSQPLPARAFTLGKYYRLKLLWDGTKWKRQSLVAHWPMDGNTNDVFGNGHHGTIVGGVTPTEDHSGNANGAYLFNGTDGYIDLGSWENGGTMTFTFWARWDRTSGISRIIELSGGGEYANGIVVGNVDTDITFHFLQGSINELRATGAVSTEWGFYAATVDGKGVMKIYKNGVYLAQKTTYVPKVLTRNKQYIGKSTFSVDGMFKGAIDDLRIYNYALSAEEMLALYNSTL